MNAVENLFSMMLEKKKLIKKDLSCIRKNDHCPLSDVATVLPIFFFS